MRLLLTGKNGQVGFELQRALAVLGEVIAIDSEDCDLADEAAIRPVVRTSWVVAAHGGNFAKTMLCLAGECDTLSVVADQFGAPTSAALLADLTAHLVRQAQRTPADFPYGLYHAVAAGETNWHAYGCHVIERARSAGKAIRVAPDAIKSITTSDYPTPAKLPANSRLDTSLLRETFGLQLPDWKMGIDHILDQIL
jgi:dTDP-4-dehydrorhamnose reductase